MPLSRDCLLELTPSCTAGCDSGEVAVTVGTMRSRVVITMLASVAGLAACSQAGTDPVSPGIITPTVMSPAPSSDPDGTDQDPTFAQTDAQSQADGATESGGGASAARDRRMTPRGNLLKEVGEGAGLTDAQDPGRLSVGFRVLRLISDLECGAPGAPPPANGHYLGLLIEVQLDEQLPEEPDWAFQISAADFRAWSLQDESHADVVGNGGQCLQGGEYLPDLFNPGQTGQGWVVLDVPIDEGMIELTYDYIDGGWEWRF